MKIKIINLKINNQIFTFDKIINLNAQLKSEIKSFFTGEISFNAEIEIDNRKENTSNYLEFLNSVTNSQITPQILQEHIIESSETNIIDTKITNLNIQVEPNTQSDAQAKYHELTSNLTASEVEEFNKISDIMVKIKRLDKEIADYQNGKGEKENLDKDIKAKETAKLKLEQKLTSVQSLLKRKNEILKQMETMQNVNNLNNIQTIKDKRIESRNIQLTQGFTKRKTSEILEKNKDSWNIKYPYLLIFLILELIITIFFYISTKSFLYLLIGMTAELLMGGIFLMLQKSDQKSVHELNPTANTQEDNVNKDYTNLPEDKLLMDAALINALNYEKESIDGNINHALDNQSYETVEQQFNTITKELIDLKAKKESPESNISVDDYYKKRRELDILKIEKDNIDFSSKLAVKPSEEYITLLTQINNETSEELLYLPVIVISKERKFDEFIEKYKNIRQVIVLYESA